MTRTLILLCLLCACANAVQGANWYVRLAATGANNGTDWNNAFNTPLVNASQWSGIAAGDTLWIAGGGQYGMVGGKSGVTIKRATAANPECTGAAGWSSAFDAQVVIGVGYLAGNAGFRFVPPYSDNITVDGQVANGIKFVLPTPGVDVNTQTAGLVSGILSVGNSNVFQYIEIEGPGTPSNDTGFTIGDNYHYGWKTNVTIRSCSIHGCSNGIQAGDTDAMLIERNEISYCYGNLYNHDNCTFMFGGNTCVFRYNVLHNFDAMGIYLNAQGPPGPNNWKIYGNVVYQTGGDIGNGQALVFDPSGSTPWQLGSGWEVYNNTFANTGQGIRQDSRWPGTYSSATTGGAITNNVIWVGAYNPGVMSHNYNFSSGSVFGEANGIGSGTLPFVNATAGDLHILSTVAATYPRNKGTALAAEFNTDRDGVSRTGLWSIGAYEYPGAGSAGQIQVSAATVTVSEGAGTITITLNRIGGSTGAASVNYTTVNGTATSGVNYTATSGTKNWAGADAADKTFTITVANTAMVGSKTFSVQLSGVTGASLGQSVQTITLTGTGSPASCLLSGWSWEAESACSIVTPMTTNTAGGVTYIYGTTTTDDYTVAGKAVYTFTNSVGGYRIRASVNAPDGGRNSFFVGTNSAAPDIWDVVSFTSGFETRYVSLRGSGTFDNPQYPNAVFTPAGTNTITIYSREANTLLDSLTLEPVVVNIPPVVTSLSTTLTNLSSYVAAFASAGSNIPVTVTWSTNVTVTGAPYLQLDSGGTATYTSGTGTSNLLFTCTVGSSENSQALNATNIVLNGGTLRNGGVDATLTLPVAGGAGSLQAQQLVVVDTVKPVTSISAPTTILAPTGSSVSFLVSYTDLNLPRSALGPSAADVTITGTATATKTITSGTSPSSATVTLSSLTTGTLTISIAANTAADLAGNLSIAAGPSQTVTVYNGATAQVITTRAGTVISSP